MKTKSQKDLPEKTVTELKQFAASLKKDLTMARLQVRSGKPKGGSNARLADQLARALTVLRNKELGL